MPRPESLLFLFSSVLLLSTRLSSAQEPKGKNPADPITAKSFVAIWKDANDTIHLELRLGKWDNKDNEKVQGEGKGFLTFWDGPAKDMTIAKAGFVVWKMADNDIRFDGAVAKGSGVLQVGGKELLLSWGKKKVILIRQK